MNTPPLEEILEMAREHETHPVFVKQAPDGSRTVSFSATIEHDDRLRELLDKLEAFAKNEADGPDASLLRWDDGVAFAIRQMREYLDTANKND